MARSQQTIYNSMVTDYVANAAAAGITINPAAWSMYNLQRLIFWTVAGGMGVFEQIQDLFVADVTAQVKIAAPQTAPWLQNQMLNVFQFNATDPQIVEITAPTFAPKYPTENSTYKIIKYCSVVGGTLGRCLIKVAADNAGVPADLDTTYGAGTLDCAQGFVNQVSDPELTYVVTSGAADKVMIMGTLYFKSQYAAVIAANVKAAVNAYLATQTAANPGGIPFDGTFQNSSLIDAVLSAPGVNDFVITNLNARADITPFVPGTYNLISGSHELQRNFPSVAGYFQTETTASYTIDDTITYVPQ